MELREVIHREFKAIGANKGHADYLGEIVITNPVEMSTGYTGSGVKPLFRTFPAGTVGTFRLFEFGDGFRSGVLTKKCSMNVQATYEGKIYSFDHTFDAPLSQVEADLGLLRIAKTTNL